MNPRRHSLASTSGAVLGLLWVATAFILPILKIAGVVEWSWIWIGAPIWIWLLIRVLSWIILFAKFVFIAMQTRKGWSLYQQRRFDEASRYFRKALAVFPTFEDARIGEQQCSEWLNDFTNVETMLSPPYDIFLSYKSDNVYIVRQVADALMACGRKVWFAEYHVLAENYNEFQRAIDEGIRNSKYGLAFTSKQYAASEHCIHEMELLLHYCDPQRVLLFDMGDGVRLDDKFAGLARSPQAAYSGTIGHVFSFIESQTGWRLNANGAEVDREPTPQLQTVGQCVGRPFRLDTAGWRQIGYSTVEEYRVLLGGNMTRKEKELARTIAELEGRAALEEHPIATFEFADSKYPSTLCVSPKPYPASTVIGEQDVEASFRKLLTVNYTSSMSDRELYEALLPGADRMQQEILGARPRGLHLFFHSGLAHMGLSHWQRSGVWGRRYDIRLPEPTGNGYVIFTIAFDYGGPSHGFFQHVHRMERLTRSLQW